MSTRLHFPPGFGVRQPLGALAGSLAHAKAAEGCRSPKPCRVVSGISWFLVAIALAMAACIQAIAQQPAGETAVRFRTVDILIDSNEQPLAAYQLEFIVTNGKAKIVGIEGGEHTAFAQPPFYDPKAMQQERVIIAAFSTEAVEKLPKGKIRVATIHVQISGETEPGFQLKLQTAADANGEKLEAKATSQERKPE